jgi:drug/metabolite transporter (DMT)-like permease
VFVALVPLVTSFASAPLIAEQPNVSEVAGMIVVVLGVALSLRS